MYFGPLTWTLALFSKIIGNRSPNKAKECKVAHCLTSPISTCETHLSCVLTRVLTLGGVMAQVTYQVGGAPELLWSTILNFGLFFQTCLKSLPKHGQAVQSRPLLVPRGVDQN